MYNIIISAIIGALIGGVVHLLSKKLKNEKLKKFTLPIIVGLIIGTQPLLSHPVVKNTIMSFIDSDYAKRENLNKKLSAIGKIPQIKEKMDSMSSTSEARLYINNLVSRGIKRLSTKDLKSWNEVKLKLATISPHLCSGFWNGQINAEVFLKTLSNMQEQEQDLWASISVKAAKLELAQAEYITTSRKDFIKGFMKIRDLNMPEDQVKMDVFMKQGKSISSDNACWMLKKILAGASKIDEESSIRFIRSLAAM